MIVNNDMALHQITCLILLSAMISKCETEAILTMVSLATEIFPIRRPHNKVARVSIRIVTTAPTCMVRQLPRPISNGMTTNLAAEVTRVITFARIKRIHAMTRSPVRTTPNTTGTTTDSVKRSNRHRKGSSIKAALLEISANQLTSIEVKMRTIHLEMTALVAPIVRWR